MYSLGTLRKWAVVNSIHALNLFSLEFAGTIHLYSILKTDAVHMKGRGCKAAKRPSSRLYKIKLSVRPKLFKLRF
jgi:hypothetical protein